MEQLSDDNFLVFAMNSFEAPMCLDLDEFKLEMKRFKYITKSFKGEVVNVRLVLNHIIILYNLFGLAATRMLMFKVSRDYWAQLIPFLIYLNRLTEEQINTIMIDICLDDTITNELRNL